MTSTPRDPWAALDARTPARIAIGRAGASLPTREVLSFALAHARARDAVHARLDRARLGQALEGLRCTTVLVESLARDRALYLSRPDLGRRLDEASRARLQRVAAASSRDLAIVIGDGLSATAVDAHAATVIQALIPHLARIGLSVGPIVLAEGARVALGDEIGEVLRASLVAVLIGERPGLSGADSLSMYLTYAPRVGRTDAERNCISNIRPEGLAPDLAAGNLAWLIDAARRSQATGIMLKDRSDDGHIAAPAT